MLRPLLYLAALSQLAGASNSTTEIDISSCPIPYFGKLYKTLYVDISGGKLAICFSPGTQNHCLLAASGGITNVESQIGNSTINPGSDFHLSLGQLTGSSPCSVILNLKDDSNNLHMTNEMRPFEDQSAVSVKLHNASTQSFLEVSVQVDGVALRHWNLTENQMYYKDVSGCRHSGVVYEPNTVACDSEASSTVSCNASAALSISPCGPERRCRGNGQCVLNPTCTVTGPTVIDFSGHVSFVRDRCAYTLMSAPGLQLLATFQERRRRDVSFLDHVILRLDGPAVNIYLGQGGKVQLDNTALSLSSSPQTVHGVQLAKDKTGVTAKVTLSNYTSSIFFDGTTAQIRMKGPASLQGLCVNSSSSLSEVRLSELSSTSCETQYSEPADGRINCTVMTERCNLLKEAPFTSCHSHVDPEPYITACTDTLCRYPAVDGLNCQFLEAYARACSRLSNETLEGWMSKTRCSPPQGSCQDTFCSAHEFCGEEISGRSRCFCRADFASKYRSGALGDPTVCGDNTASLSLAGCLLAEKGINHSVLHLNDHTCVGQMDEKTHMVTFDFDNSKPCGAVVLAGNNKITYKNTIKTDNSSTYGLISRHDSVNIDFSCFYSQPDVKTMSFRMKGGNAVQQIVSGSWNYSLSMSMCSDAACTKPIDFSQGIQMDQTIYINMNTKGLDGNIITLVTESCWATNKGKGNNALRYDLVKNGCGNPQDRTVKVLDNGKGGTVLAFQMFQFKGSNSGIFLQCKMKLCVKNNPKCQPKCQRGGGRKQRSVRPEYEDENPAIVSLAWT